MVTTPSILTTRSFISRHFALELGGLKAGFLKSVEGGGVKAEVVTQAVGGHAIKAKHIGIPQVEPITIAVGMSMSKAFWSWMSAAWSGDIVRKEGAVLALDHNLDIVHEMEFQEALITETTIPALDGAAKEPGYITVKFQSETVRHKTGSKGKFQATYDEKQKLWLPSNFRLEIADLDCSKVSKIDSFTVKQGVKRLEVGPDREYVLEPTNLEYPNLSVTFSLATAESWFKWHEDFVIKGNNDPSKEKKGQITLLSPNRQQPLFEIGLDHIGISNLVVDKGDAGSDAIRRVKAELYVEEMSFKHLG